MRLFILKLFGSKPLPGTVQGPLTDAERVWLNSVLNQDTRGW